MSSKNAYSYLVKLLSTRDYSEHKLREKLYQRNYPANEIDEAINEIKARNFLREDNYIEARVKAFMNKGYSPDYIRQKLEQERLTVTDKDIEDIFSEHKISVEEQIDRLVRKKLNGRVEIDFDEETKILRYVLGKGHDFSISKRVLKLSIVKQNLK